MPAAEFDAVVADVVTLTARPDLEDETALAVKAATMMAHAGGAYYRDCLTVSLPDAVPAYIASVDYPTDLPQFRGLNMVQILDVDEEPVAAAPIEIVEPGDIFDPVYRNKLKANICYVAGTELVVSSSIPAYGYLISYYKYPLTARADYDSWIAAVAPDIIIYRAAAIVLGTNGNEEKSKSYLNLVERIIKPQFDASWLTGALR